MIMNISGAINDHTIETPEIHLPYGNYSFSLLNFIGNLEHPIKFSEIIEISCNLVQRDEANPHRVIGFFESEDGSLSLKFTPTQKIEYKLRVNEISGLEIKLRGLTSDQIFKFTKVALQIQIEETYARL